MEEPTHCSTASTDGHGIAARMDGKLAPAVAIIGWVDRGRWQLPAPPGGLSWTGDVRVPADRPDRRAP